MEKLPRRAQLFLMAMFVGSLAAVASIRAIADPILISKRNWTEVGLFVLLAAFAGSRKVRLMRTKRDEDVGSMSLGFAITFTAMLRCGPDVGLAVGLVSCLSGCMYPKLQPMHQLAFNLALTAVESWVAGFVFLHVNGGHAQITEEVVRTTHHLSLPALSASLPFLRPTAVPAIACSAVTYYLCNTGAVATIIALCTDASAYDVWKRNFLWVGPSYFAGASVGALTALGVRLFPTQDAITVLLFVVPVVWFTFRSYKVWTEKAEEKQQHIEELQLSQAQLAELYLATIKSLALAIDAKDQYTHEHILRVQKYAMATAEEMGLSGGDMEAVKTGALLHDIGKMGVPEYVLLKPSPLTDEEFAKIRKHPEIGAAILDPVPFPWPVVPVVRYHHEKWDGTGYPEGLKGEGIPLTARILAVADAYDAMTSSRSYRKPRTHAEAQAVLRRDAGSHFDPEVVGAFLRVIGAVVAEIEGERGAVSSPLPTSIASVSKADQAVLDIQRASSELWALYEVAQTLSSSLGIQETLDILARKLEAIFPGTAILFMLRDERTNLLVARASVGTNKEYFDGCRTVSAASCSARVVIQQQTYAGEYDQADLLLTTAPGVQWVPLRSALIVPVVHEGEVLGTVNLYHPQEEAFGPHDRQMLETIAERAAMALYNGILFERTRSHAFTDPLTGLYNVRYLTQYVEERCNAAAQRHEGARLAEGGSGESELPSIRQTDAFALLILDLDSFKPINDNFGHQRGDQVLRDIGRVFRSTVREGDVVARYGGDEFLVIIDQAGPQEAEEMAARLQEAVRQYDAGLVHPRIGPIRLGVSAGCACFPRDGVDCASLLSAADTYMYRSKTEKKLGLLADGARAHAAAGEEERATLTKAA